MAELTMRQFYVVADIGITIRDAERKYQVEVRPLDRGSSQLLYKGRLISVEGDHDDVYRLIDQLCPDALSDDQRQKLIK